MFVSCLNLSDGTKELLMNLLPNLSNEELMKFINVLEEKYASEETDLLDIELENELAKIAVKYGEAQRKADEQTLKKMDNLFKKKK